MELRARPVFSEDFTLKPMAKQRGPVRTGGCSLCLLTSPFGVHSFLGWSTPTTPWLLQQLVCFCSRFFLDICHHSCLQLRETTQFPLSNTTIIGAALLRTKEKNKLLADRHRVHHTNQVRKYGCLTRTFLWGPTLKTLAPCFFGSYEVLALIKFFWIVKTLTPVFKNTFKFFCIWQLCSKICKLV